MDLDLRSNALINNIILGYCLLGVITVFATENGTTTARSYMLNPIVVTAQKLESHLADVPAAVAVLSEDRIADTGIRHLEDLSLSVPNLTVGEAAVSSLRWIRGIGSGVNQGFEQSVALFVDGVYHGRSRQSRLQFLDIERVEIVKGPQGFFFGKNSPAGAINIITANPGNQFESQFIGSYVPEYDGREVEGFLSGPLAEGLSGRLAARTSDFDGYLRNSVSGRDEPGIRNDAVRGTLSWYALEDMDITAKYEFGRFEVDGRSTQVVESGPFGSVFSSLDPLFEDQFDESRSVGGRTGAFAPEQSETTTNNSALTINYYAGEHVFTGVTGYSTYEFDELVDADLSANSIIAQIRDEEFYQISQELRIASPKASSSSWLPWAPDAIDYLAGLYYHYSQMDVFTSTNFDIGALTNLGLPFPAFAGSQVNRTDQDTHSWSAFGHLQWHMTDDVRLGVGVRYSGERKSATKNLFIADLGTRNANPGLDPLFAAVLNSVPHNFDEDRDESHVTPTVSLQWDIAQAHMVYASYTRGTKAGGFDDAATSGKLADYEFGDEVADGFEIGAKSSWFEGAADLNIALFRTEFDDLQVSAFDGVAGFAVGNAASVITQGVEIDGRWRITESFTLAASVAYLHSRYDSFIHANCTAAQTAAFNARGAPGACTQDLSGRETMYAPEWTGNVYAEYQLALDRFSSCPESVKNLQLITKINLNATGEFFLAQDLDPNLLQTGYAKADLRVALGDRDGTWELACLIRNITDELTSKFGNDVPVLSGSFFKLTDPPRTVMLQARISW